MKNFSKTKSKKNTNKKNEINKEIIGILIISFGILLLYSMNNESSGIFGQLIGDKTWQLVGFGGYFIPYITIIIGIMFLINKFNIYKTQKSIPILIIFISYITILDINFIKINKSLTLLDKLKMSSNASLSPEPHGGGIIGGFTSYIFVELFGEVGSYIVILTIIIVSILIMTNISIVRLIKNSLNKILYVIKKSINSIKEFVYVDINKSSKIKKNKPKNKSIKETKKQNNEHDNTEKEMDKKIKILDYTKNEYNNTSQKENYPNKSKENINSSEDSSENNKEENIDTIENIEVNNKEYKEYKFPDLNILKTNDTTSNKKEKKTIINNAKKLEDILSNFGIQAQVIQISRGPTITRYELQPAPGIKVSKIVNLSDDIALGLASSDIRIEAPIPGKAAIGIEVPNNDKSVVNLRDVIETNEYDDIKSKVPFALGKDIAGKPIIANIEKMPHLLIAGATGSGKSVCINTLITSLLYKSKPDEVKLLMIDPKVVELSIYNGIPHLLIPVVTDPRKAASALNWAVQEMNKRYNLFAEKGVRDISSFNSKSEEESSSERLPQIVVIIDELADLMMVSPNEVEDSICRLAQMARAAGIHLIVATQRPSVDIITGTIKANIPSRISFAVSSQADSRTILDMGGAEKLLGKGDMLFYPVGASKPKRLQGAFISEKEVEEIVEFLKNQSEAEYKEEIIDNIEKEVNTQFDDSDELLPDAIDLVVKEGQASISYLQRKLKVGYSRAARIVDEMEERGIVGPHEGSKPRKVLVSKQDIEE